MDGCIYLSIYLVAVKFVPEYILGPNVNNIVFSCLSDMEEMPDWQSRILYTVLSETVTPVLMH